MTNPHDTLAPRSPVQPPRRFSNSLGVPPKLLYILIGLCAAFSFPLYGLVRFALQSELYSYVLLVPFVSVYLFASRTKKALPSHGSNRLAGAVLMFAAAVTLAAYLIASSSVQLIEQDSVAYTTLAFLLMVAGACAFVMDRPTFRAATFPLIFLLFMVPFPVAMEHTIESFLQRGSAPPAYWLLKLVGTPVFREDMVFQLPGITLQIAPECSGIRSSIVLFMTSLVAGHLFLKSHWSRAVLAVVVLPLALIRNGFRVFTIGQLCVSVGPHMIDSAIHHQGGSIFFALSLVPFFLLLWLLIKIERRVSTLPLKPQSPK